MARLGIDAVLHVRLMAMMPCADVLGLFLRSEDQARTDGETMGLGAQELTLEDVKTHRPSFEFEQCANACQIELDKAASTCMVSADSEAKAVEMGICAEQATDRNRSCQKLCPPDTGE